MSQNVLKQVTVFPFEKDYRQANEKHIGCGLDIHIQSGAEPQHLKYRCTKVYLEKLIEKIDLFLQGNITEEENIFFPDPLVLGNVFQYPYSFRMQPQAASWVFFSHTDAYGLERTEICTFSQADLLFMKEQLTEQVNAIDWDAMGKLMLYTFKVPDKAWRWFYSAQEMENYLRSCCKEQKLCGMYICSMAYVCSNNSIDTSSIMLEMNDVLVELWLPEMGMAACRVFARSEIQINAEYDHIHDWYDEYCEISDWYDEQYKGRTVQDVTIVPGTFWGWKTDGFNPAKITDCESMPQKVLFELDEHRFISIRGGMDELELNIYYSPDR